MARAVERIERDIAVLEEAIGAVAAELDNAYASYLTALSQAVRQHLVLASYNLCTQGYPEHFLSLSFNQRQQLQQAIRQLGQQAADQLLDAHPQKEADAEAREDEELKVSSSPYPSNPRALAEWQQNLETAIALTLKTASRDANRLLQQVGILPRKLPEPLLEAAAKVEASAETVAGPPNLLNLLVETESDEQSGNANMTHITAIHLRLSEIEFADIQVRAGRNQIRNLLLKVNSLGQEYQKKQREWTIAQAEAAWRASWSED
ncbi:MAG: hypothetical protein JOZ78_19720 [Chroococcidiopsidaceae cyanobacterium CP_BM_ER_R8_30]|nr:hypothetical protein [Chroococcidiopsidaceae cyanobacterium CP_BM_ER_R8_30]